MAKHQKLTRISVVNPEMNPSTRELGGHWENAAESFLHRRGLTTKKRNFYSRFGEIDLIMRDRDVLVFVEVRFRGDDRYGSGAETVTVRKQAKLARAAMFFLSLNPHYSQKPCRFDVISVGTRRGKTIFNWIKNAFDSPSG